MARNQTSPKAMSKSEFETYVRGMVTDAENWKEQEVAPERLTSWDYWQGNTNLPVQPNRSKVVMTEVSDTVEQTMPQLMDMFTAGDTPVIFEWPQNQAFAEQATAAANYVFWTKNKGWTLLEDFCRDALIAKTGVFKVSMRKKNMVTEASYSGLNDDQFTALAADDDVEVLEYGADDTGISCRVRRVKDKPEYYVDCIAPEDTLIDRQATSTTKTDYRLIGERRIMMVSDAVEMGIPFDKAVENSGYVQDDYEEQERQARRERTNLQRDAEVSDPSTKSLVIYEIYTRCDKDGDGVAELRKIVAIGDRAAYIHSDEIVEDHPYAIGTPIKIPHSVIGKSQADMTRDLQDINTQIMRQTLDNIVHHNNPRTWFVENQVTLRALQDNRFNGLVPLRQPGSVGHLQIPFVGDKSLAILNYMDERKEQRTGISQDSMALNAEHLQSSSEVGVRAVIGASQTHIKMIARTLCETGLSEMYRKLLCLMVKHQNEPMAIMVNGTPMDVDPRMWDMDMPIKVNVGTGAGTREEKIGALMQVAEKQETVLQQYGPQNPVCTVGQYGNTLHTLTQLAGITSSNRYWKPAEVMEMEAKQQPPPPDPAEALKAQAEAEMQIEMMKIQAKQQADQAKLQADTQLSIQKAQIDGEIELMKARMQMDIERMKTMMQAEGDMDKAAIDAAVQEMKVEQDGQLKAAELAIEAKLEKYRIDNDPNQGQANLRQVN